MSLEDAPSANDAEDERMRLATIGQPQITAALMYHGGDRLLFGQRDGADQTKEERRVDDVRRLTSAIKLA